MRFFAFFTEALEGVTIAIDALKANRARALLTIMGVALGVFVVVAMSSVVRGINESFRRDLEAAGPSSFYVYRRPIGGFNSCDGTDETCPERRNPGITLDEAAAIERLPTIRAVTSHVGTGEKFKYKDRVMNAGMEAEFFLFKPAADGRPATDTHDIGGYFDLAPMDLGEDARRAIVDTLEQLGFEVEAAHHEVAHGQHEIDFRYADALRTADNIATFRFVVKQVARQFGLIASFMPKPVFGQNGSGMHTHQSLFKSGQNAFWDPQREWELSKTALHYIGGLLKHARAMCAVTNPLVNSYKRLVPGFEAPVNVAWSMRNRSPMIRVPERRGAGTRLELRTPDPSANPYLALTVMLAAGLDGLATDADWREPVNTNIWDMSYRERRRLRVDDLPHDLNEACDELEKDEVLSSALGDHIAQHFLVAKRAEWREYNEHVSAWELERYLARY